MPLPFPQPSHMPCPECGASVAAGEPHDCDGEQRVDFQLHELRDEIDRLEDDLATWLDTPDGRFAQWIAAQRR